MKDIKRAAAAVFAACMFMTGCQNSTNDESSVTEDTTASEEASVAGDDLSEASVTGDDLSVDGDESFSIYTGREVENEEDLAIFKISAAPPEGFETLIDNAEGKLYASPNGSVTIKAQNFKEEFSDLETFAEQGCATIKVNNMFYQADTEFSEPEKTTVAGFDAIKYDYTITAYMYLYETDAEGNQKLDSDGNPILTDETEVYGEYVDRAYFFYSDEDVFYIICEAKKENAEAAAKEFDEFISTVTII